MDSEFDDAVWSVAVWIVSLIRCGLGGEFDRAVWTDAVWTVIGMQIGTDAAWIANLAGQFGQWVGMQCGTRCHAIHSAISSISISWDTAPRIPR